MDAHRPGRDPTRRGSRVTIVIDLHTHTVYSDGRATPTEIIDYALHLGLRALAITDHNNGRGAREGEAIARERGLLLIPGIEWYVNWEGYRGTVDLLGLGLDLWDPRVRRAEEEALVDFEERMAECCGYLTKMGYPLSIDEARAINPLFAGHNAVAFAAVKKGLIASPWEMDQLFSLTWPRVRPGALDIAAAIELIHAAGGVAVVAHPHQYKRDGENWSLEDLVALKALGLDGIEVYHRRMQPTDRAHFARIAEELDLLITGGSDEHGWPAGFRHLGKEPIPETLLDGLLARMESSRVSN